MKKYYFSSDFHLGHNNVLKYDTRPFKSIEEHDYTIINNHNSMVHQDDDFYFLGDFALTSKNRAEGYVSQLMGNKFFIRGNHDNRQIVRLYEKYGTYLHDQNKVTIKGTKVILNHYAMRTWEGSNRGNLHLYGHSHGGLEHTEWGKSMDVCIILNNYFPFEFEQIYKLLNSREVKLLGDHDK